MLNAGSCSYKVIVMLFFFWFDKIYLGFSIQNAELVNSANFIMRHCTTMYNMHLIMSENHESIGKYFFKKLLTHQIFRYHAANK